MRLFVAIELGHHARKVLAGVQSALKPECDGVRWIPVAQIHLTVKFLGEVQDGDMNQVAAALERAGAGATAFDMRIAGCGCFPPRGPARIVWAGVADTSGALLRLVEAVETELVRMGFPAEQRRFSPHITIGRVRQDRSDGQLRSAVQAHAFSPTEQSVASITLMSSVLSSKGPTYTPVSVSNLGRTEL